MYGLLTRTVKVLIWGTLGAFGVILLFLAILQPLGIFVMFDNINDVKGVVETTGAGTAAETVTNSMSGMAAGISIFMILQSIVCLVIGIPLTLFCGKKILSALTDPIPTRSDIRQDDAHGQVMAVLIFSFGIFVGFKGLERDGRIFLRDVTEYTKHYETKGTILSIDPEYIGIPEEAQTFGGSKKYSGTYSYQTPNGQTITKSGPLSKYTGRRATAGTQFPLHFNPDTPEIIRFNSKATAGAVVGDIFSCLIFIWLIAAGIAGAGANILPERKLKETEADGYDPQHAQISPREFKPNNGNFGTYRPTRFN